MKRIAICIPIKGNVSDIFLLNFSNQLIKNSRNYDLFIVSSTTMPLDSARNEILQLAMKNNPDYLWWLDSDIILPKNLDVLQSLIKNDKDIVSALYFKKEYPYHPVFIIIKDGKPSIIKPVPLNQILKVDAVGLGCCLIKREVFEKMLEKNDNKPIFEFKKHKLSNNEIEILSEDTTFCFKAKKNGFKIFVNTGLICKHIGKSFIDENFYNFYLNLENKDKQ